MKLDADICYRAISEKDRSFDGRFYVGVKSTRIYCRPICPARTPRRDRCEFYETAAAAEQAGFMPCLRCRPDLVPGNSSVDAKARLAERASNLLGRNRRIGIEELAARLGVTSRHLRRALQDELGVTPARLRQLSRVSEAKRLLTETALPLTRIAYASGFASLRRFNAAFRQMEGRSPSELRKSP
ncbi:MAG: methylphosphotriester-DNA--protein-cysteine methyltransferase family protein [Planctomycetes bacterium]|nr:methylphosphotriester-DNA--protein-cysteine methyltransferase family protein [Planctomycetota bacterium]